MRGAILLMISLPFVAGASPAAPLSSDDRPFGLTPPVRLVQTGFYRDGGTISAKLRDGIGRTFDCGFAMDYTVGLRSAPHVYIGAPHWRNRGARFLPVWQEEEQELLSLLQKVLDDSLGSATQDSLERVRLTSSTSDSARYLSRLVGAVRGRFRMLSAFQRGELADVRDAQTYFGFSGRPTIEAVDPGPTGVGTAVRVRDEHGKEMTFISHAFGSSQDACLWTSGARMRPGSIYEPGWYTGRYALTILLMALREDQGDTKLARGGKVVSREDRREALARLYLIVDGCRQAIRAYDLEDRAAKAAN